MEKQKPVHPAANHCPEKPITGRVRCDAGVLASAVPKLPTDRGAEGGAGREREALGRTREAFAPRMRASPWSVFPCQYDAPGRVFAPHDRDTPAGAPLLRPKNGAGGGRFFLPPGTFVRGRLHGKRTLDRTSSAISLLLSLK